MLREEVGKSCFPLSAQRISGGGISNILPFSGDVCLPKILRSSRLGQSIGMRLVFMLKETCDVISILYEQWEEKNTDELPAFLICNAHQISLPKIYTAHLVPKSCLKLVPRKIMTVAHGLICLD